MTELTLHPAGAATASAIRSLRGTTMPANTGSPYARPNSTPLTTWAGPLAGGSLPITAGRRSAYVLRNRLVSSPTAAGVAGCSSSRHHTRWTGTGGASRNGR